MPDLFTEITHNKGKVYRNSKLKTYSDGTKNLVAHSSPVFRDKCYQTETEYTKQDRKIKEREQDREVHQQLIDDVYATLERCNLKEYEFYDLMYRQSDDDFLIRLSSCGMSLQEFDKLQSYFNRAPKQQKPKSPANVPRSDSMKRAKDSIFDFVLQNDFEYFFTGTINPGELDSKNPKELLKPVQDWLSNMVRRYNLKYIMVAELHKVSKGIHFHGLLKGDNMRLVDSGTKLYKGYSKPVSNDRAEFLGLTDGRTVYNLATWGFGFSTCIKLTGDRMKTAFYITKYITKECKKIFGKFFWHSRDLVKPQITVQDVDFDKIDSAESNGFKYVFARGEDQCESLNTLLF